MQVVSTDIVKPGMILAKPIYRGSWSFIIGFLFILLLWIVLNSAQLIFHPFDPFPFILLNLVLSCVSAIQAPVIMIGKKGPNPGRARLKPIVPSAKK